MALNVTLTSEVRTIAALVFDGKELKDTKMRVLSNDMFFLMKFHENLSSS
jgi:hypothetical protein